MCFESVVVVGLHSVTNKYDNENNNNVRSPTAQSHMEYGNNAKIRENFSVFSSLSLFVSQSYTLFVARFELDWTLDV